MPRHLPRHALLALATVLTLAIGLLAAKLIVDGHRETGREARADQRNLLAALEQSISRSLTYCSHALRATRRLLDDPLLAQQPPALQERLLFSGTEHIPGQGAMLVVDANGRVVRTSNPTYLGRVDLRDRDYFIVHQQHDNAGIYVSAPFESRLSGEPSIALSLRLNTPDGRFAGIVVNTLRLSYLRTQFDAVELDPGTLVQLLRDDGGAVVRSAAADAPPWSDDGTFARYLAERPDDASPVQFDDTPLLQTFHTLPDYPLTLHVARPLDAVFAPWQQRAVTAGVVTLLLMAGCLALAYLFQRELHMRQAVAARLRRAEDDLRIILDGMPSLIGYWDHSLHNRFANHAYQASLGLDTARIRGQTMAALLGPAYAQSREHAERALRGDTRTFEQVRQMPDGSARHLLVTYIPDDQGADARGFFEHGLDISVRKATENALFEEKERFRVTLRSIGDAVVSTSVTGTVQYLNPAAEMLTGWSLDEALGRPIDEVMDLRHASTGEPQANPARLALQRRASVTMAADCVLICRHGARYDIEDSAAPITDAHDTLVGAVMVLRDVTATRALSTRMAHLAQHDALTDLPNRVLLLDRATQSLARAKRAGNRIAVLYLDLDRFKHVNDSLGHDVGDRLLIEAARRLQGLMRVDDTLSRQGGDEFVILLQDLTDPAEAGFFAQRLVNGCAEPFEAAGHTLSLTVSIGIALYPDDGDTFETLSKNADTALYVAKQAGRNQFQYFTRQHGDNADRRLLREQGLKQAIARDELRVYYQPRVNYAAGRVAGLEALVRWQTDDGLLAPAEFIPLAEETGLILDLGRYVADQVARDRLTLDEHGFPPVPIAINISARQIMDPAVCSDLPARLAGAGDIELELTESVLMQDDRIVLARLQQLRRAGMRLAMDDFGTGYSSLAYLRSLPLDILKLDKSFVCGLGENPRHHGITQTIISLAHHLRLHVVAEGVESRMQADLLLAMGCQDMQGYFFCRPEPLPRILDWHAGLRPNAGEQADDRP